MINTQVIEDVVQKIDALVPEDIKTMRQDFHQNLKSILTASLQKADLVTREEFEVQKAVLAKTRAKVDALEQQVRSLETGLDK